jgi:uncharacterized delta-60 repeat protein
MYLLWILPSCTPDDDAAKDTPDPAVDTAIVDTTEPSRDSGSPPDTGTPQAGPGVAAWGEIRVRVPGWVVTVDDLAIATDGAVYLAGAAWREGWEYTSDIAVTRIDPAGVPDAAFAPDGVLLMDGTQLSAATDVVPAPDGGCYVAGWDYGYDERQPFVARFTAAGVTDPTFGKVPLDLEPGPEETIGLAAVPSGGVVILRGGARGVSAVRLLDDGSLDPAFGDAGAAALPVDIDCTGGSLCTWGTVAVLPDGAVVASVGQPATVVKLDPSGLPDPAYGVGGVVVSQGPSWSHGVHVSADGQVWIGGSEGIEGNAGLLAWIEEVSPTGTLAPSVSVDVGDFGMGVEDLARDAVGRLVLAGRTHEVDWTGGHAALVRAGANGALDPTFGAGGVFELAAVNPEGGELLALEIAANGTLVAAGGQSGVDGIVVLAIDPGP